jgi:hypothetical protein
MPGLFGLPSVSHLEESAASADSSSLVAVIALVAVAVAAVVIIVGVVIHRLFFRGRLPQREFRRRV